MRQSAAKVVSAEEFRHLRSWQLIDVREKTKFKAAPHILGARNIPFYSQFKERYMELA